MQLASHVRANTHLATLVKDYGLNCFLVTAENGKLRRRVNDFEEKRFEAELSANLF